HLHRLLHRAGQRYLIARAYRDLLARVQPTARHVDCIAAPSLERLSELDRLLDIPAALDPIGAGDANRHGPVRREGSAHRIEDLEREAHAVFQAAAILVVAL